MNEITDTNYDCQPLVSVIMPCFNDGSYIKEAIDSVFAQTYENIDLTIINDCSTDTLTNEILASISHPKIKILNNERNMRPSGTRNKGIAQANGKYILPLDADDIIDKTYIEKAVKIIEKKDTIGAVYCKAELFGERSGPWNLPDYSMDHMLLDNIVFITALFRKDDWEKVGGFSIEMDAGMEDYDFWLSILQIGKEIYQIPEILFHYRIKNVSRTSLFDSDLSKKKEIYRKIYLRHPVLYEEYKNEYAIILRNALIEKIYYSNSPNEILNKIYNKLEKKPIKLFLFKCFRRVMRILIFNNEKEVLI